MNDPDLAVIEHSIIGVVPGRQTPAGKLAVYQIGPVVVLADCDDTGNPYKFLSISPESAVRIGEIGRRIIEQHKRNAQRLMKLKDDDGHQRNHPAPLRIE